MSWLPNEEWYDDLFENCKNRKEVEDRAIELIRYRDKERYEYENNAVTIAQGHAATIESLINQMY
jgi:RNA:NAD 2'-phosphotransferase (TPT1/KptA family)